MKLLNYLVFTLRYSFTISENLRRRRPLVKR